MTPGVGVVVGCRGGLLLVAVLVVVAVVAVLVMVALSVVVVVGVVVGCVRGCSPIVEWVGSVVVIAVVVVVVIRGWSWTLPLLCRSARSLAQRAQEHLRVALL